MTPKLRTFLLVGNTPVQFQFSGNPVVKHTGGETVFSLFLFEEEIVVLKQILDSSSLTLKEMDLGQEASNEIKQEPLPTCLACFWLEFDGQCGLSSMDPSTRREAMKHPEASPAIIACTTPEVWNEKYHG